MPLVQADKQLLLSLLMPPQLEHPVLPPRGDPRPVRCPVHCEDLVRMAWEVHLELASAEVPDLSDRFKQE